MQRVCRAQERIVVSQWKIRIELFRQRFNFKSIIQLDNAMQDERGWDAFFLCQTETAPQPLPAIEQWPADIVPASIHPNDRNIGKMAVVVKAMSNVGDIVLDPFCGSAAIGVACILLGRKYIGIELMEDRAEDARKRIEAAHAVIAERTV
jgi:DNA modification methylase